VEDIDFDTQACKLRLKGRNIEENDHVKMGAYHTIDLVRNLRIVLSFFLYVQSKFAKADHCFESNLVGYLLIWQPCFTWHCCND